MSWIDQYPRIRRQRLAIAYALSLSLHALIISLEFGVPGLGLPELVMPWEEKRATGDSLTVRLTEPPRIAEPVVAQVPVKPPRKAQVRPIPPRPASALTSVTLRTMKRAPLVRPVTGERKIKRPVRAKQLRKKPEPEIIALAEQRDDSFVVPPPLPPQPAQRINEPQKEDGSGGTAKAGAELAEEILARLAREREAAGIEEALREQKRVRLDQEVQTREAQRREARQQEQALLEAQQDLERKLELAKRLEEAKEQELARSRQLAQESEARQRAEEAIRQEALARANQLRADEQRRIEELRQAALRLEQARTEREAKELAARLEADSSARRRAEESARRKAEEVARRQAEETIRRQAEEAALRQTKETTRRQVEEAARRQTEETARRQAEEAARRQAEDAAQRQAEETARRQAEEIARRQAEETIRRQAEDAARHQADETARRKADDAARLRAAADALRQKEEEARQLQARQPETKPLPAAGLAARALEQARTELAALPAPMSLRPSSDAPEARRASVLGRIDNDVGLMMYVEAWRTKVERNSFFNLPSAAKARNHEDPVVTVFIRSDGSVEDARLNRSSGVRVIDEAVMRMARIYAPFSAFPPALARRYDVIEIRRVWFLSNSLKIGEEMR